MTSILKFAGTGCLTLAMGCARAPAPPVTTTVAAAPPVVPVSALSVVVAAPDSVMLRIAKTTTLAFVGTLRARDSVTMPIIPAAPNIWVVHVDTVLLSPESVGRFRGTDVTVQTHDSTSLAVGGTAVYFTHGLIAGTSLYVEEVGRFPLTSPGDSAGIGKVYSRFFVADSANTDDKLRPYLVNAAAVVIGTVVQIDSATSADSAAWLTADEGEPHWRRATVQTSGYFRGDSATTSPVLRVLFPGTAPAALRAVPPLRGGDRRVFAVRPAASVVNATFRATSSSYPYAVLYAFDVLPAADSVRVFRLTR